MCRVYWWTYLNTTWYVLSESGGWLRSISSCTVTNRRHDSTTVRSVILEKDSWVSVLSWMPLIVFFSVLLRATLFPRLCQCLVSMTDLTLPSRCICSCCKQMTHSQPEPWATGMRGTEIIVAVIKSSNMCIGLEYSLLGVAPFTL